MQTNVDSETLVLVCAIFRTGELRYFYDALRFIKIISDRGVPVENIRLYGTVQY